MNLKTSWKNQIWPLRVLRAWLGVTWIYAGWDKASDPGFLTSGSPTFIGTQLSAYATSSPVGFAINKMLDESKRLNYIDLPKRLKKHKNETVFTNRFQVVNPKSFSHTVVAHISCDGHYYIYPDKRQIRSISIREAARIQSFPDDYYFEGGQTASFKQIGNAVPPLMAEGIAKKLKLKLNK